MNPTSCKCKKDLKLSPGLNSGGRIRTYDLRAFSEEKYPFQKSVNLGDIIEQAVQQFVEAQLQGQKPDRDRAKSITGRITFS